MAETKRFSNKTQIANGTEETKLSMNDILISQHVTGDNADYKLTLAQVQAVPYGVCSSGASDSTKEVVLSNYPALWSPIIGSKVFVKFTNGNAYGAISAGTYPSLSCGGITAPMVAQGMTMAAGSIAAGQIVEFVYTGDAWNCDSAIREVKDGYITYSDGEIVYNQSVVDGALTNYIKGANDWLDTRYVIDDLNDLSIGRSSIIIPDTRHSPINYGICYCLASNVNWLFQIALSTAHDTFFVRRNINQEGWSDNWQQSALKSDLSVFQPYSYRESGGDSPLILIGITNNAHSTQAYTHIDISGGRVDGWFGSGKIVFAQNRSVDAKSDFSMSNMFCFATERGGQIALYCQMESYCYLNVSVAPHSKFDLRMERVASSEGDVIWNNVWR